MFKVYTKEYIKDMLNKANEYRDSRGDDFAYGFLTALVKGIVSEMEHEEKRKNDMKYVVKFGDKNLGTFTDYDCAFHCFCENESKLIEEYGYEYDDEDTITNVCDDSHIDEFLEEMRNCKKWCTFSYTEDMLTLTEER